MRLLIALLVMLGSFLICYALLHQRQQQEKKLEERLQTFAHINRPQLRQSQLRMARQQSLQERIFAFVRRLAQNWQGIKLKADYDLKMQQAGWPLLGKEFQMGLLVLAVLGAAGVGILLWSPLWALVGAVGGVLLGQILLQLAINHRRKAFANQLVDMLTMVANALRAGFSFMQGIEMVSTEMDGPMGEELTIVLRENRLGTPLEKALEDMTRRVQSSDFNLVVTAVLIQRQVGGNLAQILNSISETVAERIRMRREVMSLTAQGRFTGMILGLLPFGFAVIISMINPHYLQPLFDEDIGHMAIAGGIVLELVGFFFINKIVNIDVS